MLRYLYKAAWYSFGLVFILRLNVVVLYWPNLVARLRSSTFPWEETNAVSLLMFVGGWLLFLIWFGLRWLFSKPDTDVTRLPLAGAHPAVQGLALTLLAGLQLAIYIPLDFHRFLSRWCPQVDIAHPWGCLGLGIVAYLALMWLVYFVLASGWRGWRRRWVK